MLGPGGVLCSSFSCGSYPTVWFAVFEDNGLLFWLPDVLCRPTEVVLWSLLGVEMFFCGICEGESGLPILFLHHLFLNPIWISLYH